VLIFNTAAIWAMLAHYKEDREHIYGARSEVPRRKAGEVEWPGINLLVSPALARSSTW
jgi:hypothetical protein